MVNRRLAAAAIWGFAAIVLSVMTMVVAPLRPGTPVRAGPGAPPPVGTCGNMSETGFASVDCSSPHTVEVVYAVGAVGPSLTWGFCAQRAREYVGVPASGDDDSYPDGVWALPLRYSPRLAAGPGTGGYPGWSWLVCLVSPIGPAPWSGFRGSVRNLDETARPAALRPCFTRSADNLAVVPCTEPHRGEIVGVQVVRSALPAGADVAGSGPGGRGPTETDADGSDPAGVVDAGDLGGPGAQTGVGATEEANRRAASCRTSAAEFTATADPTYAGQVRVVVLPGPGSPLRAPLSADTGAFYGSDIGRTWLLCTVETTGSAQLLDSIANWGDRPLPVR